MSRKNPFANLDMASLTADTTPTKSGYGMTGAAKTVVRSIEEMAENTKKLMDGETIIELDPNLLDVSFVADRLSDKDNAYEDLKAAIQEHGQSTPILVRPNPDDTERYMVVFGHRRALVAKDLRITVKAVVKKLDDIAHAVAQGQENSARSNLSFIERAYFAQNLLNGGMTKDIVKSAISLDDAMLSKMLSVIEAVPSSMLTVLGASKSIGRDKWLSLRQIILNPAYLNVAIEYVASDDFAALTEDRRFDDLHDYLKKYRVRSTAKVRKNSVEVKPWAPVDESVTVKSKMKSKSYVLELSNKNAKPFGEWISNNLDSLYGAFQKSDSKETGD